MPDFAQPPKKIITRPAHKTYFEALKNRELPSSRAICSLINGKPNSLNGQPSISNGKIFFNQNVPIVAREFCYYPDKGGALPGGDIRKNNIVLPKGLVPTEFYDREDPYLMINPAKLRKKGDNFIIEQADVTVVPNVPRSFDNSIPNLAGIVCMAYQDTVYPTAIRPVELELLPIVLQARLRENNFEITYSEYDKFDRLEVILKSLQGKLNYMFCPQESGFYSILWNYNGRSNIGVTHTLGQLVVYPSENLPGNLYAKPPGSLIVQVVSGLEK